MRFRRNAGDESRRRHEREGDRVRVLIDRYRRGDLSSFNLKAAAWLGHEDAVEVARRLGVRFLTGSSEPDPEIEWDGRADDVLANREGWAVFDSGDGYRIVNTGDEGEDEAAREWVRHQAMAGDKLAVKALIFLRDLAKSEDYDFFAYGREYARIFDPDQIIVREIYEVEGRTEAVYRRLLDFPSGPSLEEITDAEAIRLVRPAELALAETLLEVES
jgi:hypothetical protein